MLSKPAHGIWNYLHPQLTIIDTGNYDMGGSMAKPVLISYVAVPNWFPHAKVLLLLSLNLYILRSWNMQSCTPVLVHRSKKNYYCTFGLH